MRMLTGTGETGTVHHDPISFAAELKLGTNSPVIELPNDAAPGEVVTYALRPLNHPRPCPLQHACGLDAGTRLRDWRYLSVHLPPAGLG